MSIVCLYLSLAQLNLWLDEMNEVQRMNTVSVYFPVVRITGIKDMERNQPSASL